MKDIQITVFSDDSLLLQFEPSDMDDCNSLWLTSNTVKIRQFCTPKSLIELRDQLLKAFPLQTEAAEFTYDPKMELPPDEIVRAAILLENWMKERGHTHWKLMGIQSREANHAPLTKTVEANLLHPEEIKE